MPRRPKIPHPTGKFKGRLRSAARNADPQAAMTYNIVPQPILHPVAQIDPSGTPVYSVDDLSDPLSRNSIDNMSSNVVCGEKTQTISESDDIVATIRQHFRDSPSSSRGDDKKGGEMQSSLYIRSGRMEFEEAVGLCPEFRHIQPPNTANNNSLEDEAKASPTYMPSEAIAAQQTHGYRAASNANPGSSTIQDGMDYQFTPQLVDYGLPSSTVPDDHISYLNWQLGSAWEYRFTPTAIGPRNHTNGNFPRKPPGDSVVPCTPLAMRRNSTIPCSAPSSSGSPMRINRSPSPGITVHTSPSPQWVVTTPTGELRQIANQIPIRRHPRAPIARSGSVQATTGAGEAWFASQVHGTRTRFPSRSLIQVPASESISPIRNGNCFTDYNIGFNTGSEAWVMETPLSQRGRCLTPTPDPGSSVKKILVARSVVREDRRTLKQVPWNYQVQDDKQTFMNDISSDTESWISETTVTEGSPMLGGKNSLNGDILKMVMGSVSQTSNGSSRADFNSEVDERIGWRVASRTPTPRPIARDITPRLYNY